MQLCDEYLQPTSQTEHVILCVTCVQVDKVKECNEASSVH